MRVENPIGIFDSGLGGLTVLREVVRLLPHENIVYFGDTARVPYGSRPETTINKYAAQDAAFLMTKNIKAMVVACGTVSSVSGKALQSSVGIPFFDVVSAGAAEAVNFADKGEIAVLGTLATIRSHSHRSLITAAKPNAQIVEQACPLFVPLVENGHTDPDDPIANEAANFYLKKIAERRPAAAILACTHYPLLRQTIQNHLPGIILIDPAVEAAKRIAAFLAGEHLNNQNGGALEFYVSDRPEAFELFAKDTLNDLPHMGNHSCTLVDIDQY
ncbi:MAG TPA: glutamate racemase [Oscillospiraceae bacterium]|nr:glutamate racemase [Oscillospiraceae bacterium]HPF57023.1 glutamate racemase [Clostridiales bacterium]HPK34828.1 glutamate racemase [Oscillospiraceae bacterium]HPR76893.1 glutamate racemase [Oscillospiraceae bacterium]